MILSIAIWLSLELLTTSNPMNDNLIVSLLLICTIFLSPSHRSF